MQKRRYLLEENALRDLSHADDGKATSVPWQLGTQLAFVGLSEHRPELSIF